MTNETSTTGTSVKDPGVRSAHTRVRAAMIRIWESPTLMTWGSIGPRVLSLMLVMPLILTRFPADQVALWYLFGTIMGLQILIDLGFTHTTGRIVGYAMAGVAAEHLKDMRSPQVPGSGVPNEHLLGEVVATMRPVYARLTLGGFVLIGVLGTLAVWRPIHASADPQLGWAAWAIVAGTSAFAIWNGIYISYLQGINRIALMKRWEMVTSLAAILSSFTVLLLGGGLLALVVVNQAWVVIATLRNRALCAAVRQGRYRGYRAACRNPVIMEAIWPSAWRTGIGTLMSLGVIQATGVLYAQIAAPAEVATYLLALRLVSMVSQFSQAPFYSKLPLLARRRAEGNVEALTALARRGMVISYWTFAAGVVAIGVLADPLLVMIGSNVRFATPELWALLGLAIFVERFGGMHVQVYSTTNHIISHIANGVTGATTIVLILLTKGVLGVYAFPIAILVGYLSFFSWYAAKHSYASTGTSFWRFERSVALQPGAVLLIYCLTRIFA